MNLSLEIVLRCVRPGSESLLPARQTEGAAGFDLRADVESELVIPPMGRHAVPTGIAVAIPHGAEGQVRPRSGLALDHGITCLNSPGTIDSDYRGEVKVILANLGDRPFVVRRGDRIAQIVFAPVAEASFRVVDALDETGRGDGGFGSTGR
ncbi:MAG TPA: dUTP diphosphatase [Candidatus Deferrimicrobiaceae bacterium]|jgi:dUTP pyrophosphatase